MEFEFWPAVIAGFTGGAVMSLMMMMAKAGGMTDMDMALIEGAMFTGDKDKAKPLGLFIHLVMMSALVFGSLYALLFAAFDVTVGNAWWWGALFGLVHGLVAGVGMVMMPAIHPRMGGAGAAPATAGTPIDLRPPGLFAKNYGSMTPIGLMMGHIVYGLVVGIVYGALV